MALGIYKAINNLRRQMGHIAYINCYLNPLQGTEFSKQGFHLISITSTENEEEGEGLHTLVFYSDNTLNTRQEPICSLELHKAFPLDYEASLIAPTVTYTNNTYIVTHLSNPNFDPGLTKVLGFYLR
jgi:hypothetical protein